MFVRNIKINAGFIFRLLFGSFILLLLILIQQKRIVFVGQKIQRKNLNTADKVNHESHVGQIVSRNINIWRSLPPGTQMGEQQVASIVKVLPKAGNLLVWGLGYDSPIWHDSSRGKVIFIEPKGVWFSKIKKTYPYLEVYTVTYTTDIVKSFDKYINNRDIWFELDLRPELPSIITQISWDVIIIDAPPGYQKGQPGRYQSIYTSSLIAKNGTHIFVDDFDRRIERKFSLKMLGNPIEIIRREAKPNAKANEQAHFIFTIR